MKEFPSVQSLLLLGVILCMLAVPGIAAAVAAFPPGGMRLAISITAEPRPQPTSSA